MKELTVWPSKTWIIRQKAEHSFFEGRVREEAGYRYFGPAPEALDIITAVREFYGRSIKVTYDPALGLPEAKVDHLLLLDLYQTRYPGCTRLNKPGAVPNGFSDR